MTVGTTGTFVVMQLREVGESAKEEAVTTLMKQRATTTTKRDCIFTIAFGYANSLTSGYKIVTMGYYG